ncbi:gastrin-releasing peptide receptor-like [Apostichopus japonicus]|uniref:gastrin-releasing peptide receptor-like n=1 Tax=Stichopus japonicus TaxID=307972 RepID=UPI003AB51808
MNESDCSTTISALAGHKGRNNFVLLCYSAILLIGVAGNGSVLYLFMREKKLRDVNNAFIINLTIGDFLFVIFFVPSSIFENVLFFRPFGLSFCQMLALVTYCSHDVSILSLVVLSFIRYRAVMHPMENFANHRINRTVIACVLIWVIAILSAIVPMQHCKEICISDFIRVHYLDINNVVKVYHICRFVVFYMIPLLLISCVYSIMAIKLIGGGAMLRRNDSMSARRAVQSRNRLGIIILTLIVVFAISWFPRYILTMFIFFDAKVNYANWNSVSNIFMSLGSCLNPIALYAASTMFRGYARKNILCCLSTHSDSSPQRLTMTSLKQSSRNGPCNGDSTKLYSSSVSKNPNSSSI